MTELKAAVERIASITLGAAKAEPPATLAHATPYLQAFGHVVIAWIWLDLARGAAAGAEGTLRASITNTARFFFAHELPCVAAWLAPLERGDRTVLQTEDDWL